MTYKIICVAKEITQQFEYNTKTLYRRCKFKKKECVHELCILEGRRIIVFVLEQHTHCVFSVAKLLRFCRIF